MSRTARRQSWFVFVFLIVVILFVTTFQMGVVRGTSMEPTYTDGQVVLVRKLHTSRPSLHHNDVILFRSGRDVLIKRVYRLPGEELTDNPFLKMRSWAFRMGLSDYYEQTEESDKTAPSGKSTRLFVPQGYIVVLGDNLRVSEDSRIFGPVPERDILGTVVNSLPPPYTIPDAPPPRSKRVAARPTTPQSGQTPSTNAPETAPAH